MSSIIDKFGGLTKMLEWLYTRATRAATPAGSDTEIQVNVVGVAGTRSGFTHDGTTLATGGDVSIPEGKGIYIGNDSGSGAATCGVVTLDISGVAEIDTTKITANSLLFITIQSDSGTDAVGAVFERAGRRTPTSNTSIASTAGALDAGLIVAWFILEPT